MAPAKSTPAGRSAKTRVARDDVVSPDSLPEARPVGHLVPVDSEQPLPSNVDQYLLHGHTFGFRQEEQDLEQESGTFLVSGSHV